MIEHKIPGYYTQFERDGQDPIPPAATAVPVFIGYSEKMPGDRLMPTLVQSMEEFRELFGGGVTDNKDLFDLESERYMPPYYLFLSLQMYFRNGGGPCYIVSLGEYSSPVLYEDFAQVLVNLEQNQEITLIVPTDAVLLSKELYYEFCKNALRHCRKVGNRFCIFDAGKTEDEVQFFRSGIGFENLMYGAAYFPCLVVNGSENAQDAEDNLLIQGIKGVFQAQGVEITYYGHLEEDKPEVWIYYAGGKGDGKAKYKTSSPGPGRIRLEIILPGGTDMVEYSAGRVIRELRVKQIGNFALGTKAGYEDNLISSGYSYDHGGPLEMPLEDQMISMGDLRKLQPKLAEEVIFQVSEKPVILYPSALAAAGYFTTDENFGVWRAPANIALDDVLGTTPSLSLDQMGNIYSHPSDKSVNLLRPVTGRGVYLWGARTLAGNDPEWRFINVRRLMNYIEKSLQDATQFAVFEPNDLGTWVILKAICETFLYDLWQNGALAGASQELAFEVNVGVGRSMTDKDVLQGRLIMEIGVAPARPAEFIYATIIHKVSELV